MLPPAAQRHQDGANYLFGDGHVKWFRPEQLSITPQNDGVHPGFGL
ncbi:MAG TPA: H-X9-DG-CTERM domain-containing protein [Abditibacterium sp.]